MSDTRIAPRDDARRVQRLAAARERRHAVLEAHRKSTRHKYTAKDFESWRPSWGTVAFDVLGYATYDDCTTNQIAFNLGRDPKDIRPIISDMRKAGLLTPRAKRNSGVIESTVAGGGYFAIQEAQHGWSVLKVRGLRQRPD